MFYIPMSLHVYVTVTYLSQETGGEDELKLENPIRDS